MKSGILLNRGTVVAPEKAGLGIQVDWEHLNAADFYVNSKPDISIKKQI